MAQDKQIAGVRMNEVLKKRRLDQPLNAKEFAVLTGVSYSTARQWFRMPGFPAIRGLVFWGDFVEWRRALSGLANGGNQPRADAECTPDLSGQRRAAKLPARAMEILAEAG